MAISYGILSVYVLILTEQFRHNQLERRTFSDFLLVFDGLEVDGGHQTHQLHGVSLHQDRVLLLPTRSLQEQAFDIHTVLKIKQALYEYCTILL